MRVLETGKSPTEMGKKRNRKPSAKDKELTQNRVGDDAEELDSEKCTHVRKSVSLNSVKKHLLLLSNVKCEHCKDRCGSLDDQASCETDEVLDEDPSVWLCLQCGNLGCGRSSKHQHALEHFKKAHSVSHAIVLNTTSWVVWCYKCDKEVLKEGEKKLLECVENIQRHVMGWSPRAETAAKDGYAHTTLVKGQHNKMEPKAKQAQQVQDSEGAGDGDIPQVDTLSRQRKNTAHLPTSNNGVKVKGLRNLGNTCFFNAVMQNLSHTCGLEKVLASYSRDGHVVKLGNTSFRNSQPDGLQANGIIPTMLPELELVLANGGAMTGCLYHFLEEMRSSQMNNVISPSKLFGQVCKKAPRFKGFQQQDSHELLRQLLDGVKSEEIKRSREAIMKAYGVEGDSRNMDEDTRAKVREYGRQAKHTFVDSMFGGHLISTVLCDECLTPSQIFEPFLDLSLPIVEEKAARRNTKESSMGSSNVFESENAQRISKNQIKKNKKLAKKEKKQQRRKTRTTSSSTVGDQDAQDEVEDEVEDEVNETRAESGETNDEFTSELTEMLENVGLDCTRTVGSTGCDGNTSNASHECLVDISKCSDNACETNGVGGCDNYDRTTDTSSKNSSEDLRNSGHSSSQNSPRLKRDGSAKSQDGKTNNGESNSVKSKSRHNSESNSVKSLSRHNSYGSEDDVECCDNEIRMKAMKPLTVTDQAITAESTLIASLYQFTREELLRDANKFGCDECSSRNQPGVENPKTVYTNARKHMLIFSPPAILTLHIKRFMQVGFGLRKNNKFVKFPLELDIAPFCSSLARGVSPGQKNVLYRLYGVVEHSGSLHGGHYTAYVKVRHHPDLHTQFMHTTGLDHDVNMEVLQKEADKLVASSATQTEAVNGEDSSAGKWYYISDSHVNESSEASVLGSDAYLLFYERIC